MPWPRRKVLRPLWPSWKIATSRGRLSTRRSTESSPNVLQRQKQRPRTWPNRFLHFWLNLNYYFSISTKSLSCQSREPYHLPDSPLSSPSLPNGLRPSRMASDVHPMHHDCYSRPLSGLVNLTRKWQEYIDVSSLRLVTLSMKGRLNCVSILPRCPFRFKLDLD